MALPSLTHLQVVVLGCLRDQGRSGREIRAWLSKEHGIRKSGPTFYQLMARLEDAGYVKGWYDKKIVGGQIIRERRYRILGEGVQSWERTTEFYRQLAAERAVRQGGLENAC